MRVFIIIIIIISFMQGIYPYIPEANYDPREYSVAAILLLLFMVLISLVSVLNLLYFSISTFRSMCAVPNITIYYYYYYYYLWKGRWMENSKKKKLLNFHIPLSMRILFNLQPISFRL